MLAIFKDVIRTKEQKSRYVWGKMVTALFCGGAAFKYVAPHVVPFIGDWAIAVGVIGFFLAYVTL